MAWLTGYGYRKSITLSRASGAVTNYQMKLLLGESSGATGEDVDCGGFCLSNFNDIRFTTSDGTTLLDYWIESISGTTPNQLATIWIEFNSIGTTATTFYMYYGESGASAGSNGPNTFLFHDHFDGDLSKWSGDTVGAAIASSEMTLTGGADYEIHSSAFAGDIALRAKAKINNADYSQLGLSDNPLSANYVLLFHASSRTNHSAHAASKSSSAADISNNDLGFDAYHIYDVTRCLTGTDTARSFTDGSQNGTGNTANVPTVDLTATFRVVGVGVTVICDWVLIRQYVENEPAWGAWGVEEEYFSGETSETATATDTIDALLYSEAISETATATDAMARSIDITVTNSETATATDSIVPDHLVDVTSDTATVTDLVEPDDLIRKKVKFPNTQAKHISLKFTSATSGSFAIYYLRHKMYKTRELCSDQKHPNTQGSHIGLKLSNSGTDAFTLMYVSEKMQLVTT